jgi:hypothetical protein
MLVEVNMLCSCEYDFNTSEITKRAPDCPLHGEKLPIHKKDNALDRLVITGNLAGYSFTKVYEVPGEESRVREELTIVFPMGATLTVSGFCSGSLENVELIYEVSHILTEKNKAKP